LKLGKDRLGKVRLGLASSVYVRLRQVLSGLFISDHRMLD